MSEDGWPKFVQITFNPETGHLFALDESGVVWEFIENEGAWFPLESKRDTS